MTTTYRIALIPGDGIGREVVPEGVKVLEKIAVRFSIAFAWDEFDWSCERFDKCGAMMPTDGIRQIADHDAIFLGAVGYLGVPDHVSLWGLLIPVRREFRQYINLRPVRLFEGVPCPLTGRGPGDIDFYIVRENNEGEYSEVGGAVVCGYRSRDRGTGKRFYLCVANCCSSCYGELMNPSAVSLPTEFIQLDWEFGVPGELPFKPLWGADKVHSSESANENY